MIFELLSTVKQMETNLQKYFHHSSFNHLTNARAMQRAKRSAKGSIFKEDDNSLYVCLNYYFMLLPLSSFPSRAANMVILSFKEDEMSELRRG